MTLFVPMVIEDEGLEGPKVWEDLSEVMKGEIS